MPALKKILRFLPQALAGKLQTIFDLESSGRLLVYSAIVGVISGLGAVGFFCVLEWMET